MWAYLDFLKAAYKSPLSPPVLLHYITLQRLFEFKNMHHHQSETPLTPTNNIHFFFGSILNFSKANPHN